MPPKRNGNHASAGRRIRAKNNSAAPMTASEDTSPTFSTSSSFPHTSTKPSSDDAPSADPVFKICGINIPLKGEHQADPFRYIHDVSEPYGHFYKLRREGKLYDVKIIDVDGKTIYGHKELLCGRIPHFKDVLTSDFVESSSGEIHLNSEQCQFDWTTVENLVDYAYTGEITLTETNVHTVMIGANYFRMMPVIKDCADFMTRRLNVDNVLSILLYYKSISYNNKTMDDRLNRFIDTNFVPISSTPNFLDLEWPELINILSRNSLHVDCEEQIFDALTRWMDSNPSSFNSEVLALKCVRLVHLSETFLNSTVLKTDWVKKSPECTRLVNQVKEYVRDEVIGIEINQLNSSQRVCDDAHRLLFSVGYDDGISEFPKESTIYIYEPIADCWMKGESSWRPLRYGKPTVVDNKIYFVGRDNANIKPLEIYDSLTNQWEMRPDKMLAERLHLTTAVFKGEIYAIGGEADRDALSTMEKYNPSDDSAGWTRMPEMTEARAGFASCVHDGMVYVFGGASGYPRLRNSSVRFDPKTARWTRLAPMPAGTRHKCSAAVLNGLIYVVGGGMGVEQASAVVERYDPATNTWTTVASILHKRSEHTLMVSSGRLFVFGGLDRREPVRATEMYDPEWNEWKERAQFPDRQGKVHMCVLPIPATSATPISNL